METITEVRDIKGQFRAAKEVDGDKIFTFVASTSDPDRHGSVLNQKNWKLDNFNANPIIGYQHNVYGGGLCTVPDPDDVIGKGRGYMEDGELLVDVVFDPENELARKIKSKIERGFLRMVSVGFMEFGKGHEGDEERGEDSELFYFHGQELLELSIVNIPSNPKAKQKSFRTQTFDALKYIYRELGAKYRFADIEDMKVRDVIDLLEGKEPVQLEEEKTDSTAPVIRKYKYEIKT